MIGTVNKNKVAKNLWKTPKDILKTINNSITYNHISQDYKIISIHITNKWEILLDFNNWQRTRSAKLTFFPKGFGKTLTFFS